MAATQSFSNSPLACYRKISPNQSGRRTMNIDTISIHCMSGNMSVESCGEWFARPTTKASSNYGIGSDGRIAIYVDESCRSWCTSSGSVDQRAVTIEVANYKKDPPTWRISEAAENSLIDLLVDICKRNNIKKLLWKADKKLLGKVDQQNMVPHRWLSSKDCPGDYMYRKFGEYAERVNKRLSGGNTTISPSTEAALTKEDPESKIWNWLIDRGLNYYAASGVMGNLYAESSLQPNNLQNSFETTLGMSDDQYTTAVDNGTYTNFAEDRAGYGLCQWTYHTRKRGLLELAKSRGTSISDIITQLVYLWDEMESYKDLIKDLNEADSIREATRIFMIRFEAPADQSDQAVDFRNQYSEGFYKRNAGSVTIKDEEVAKSEDVPFTIHTVCNVLNIRSEPNTRSKITGKITNQNEIYTIVEVYGSGTNAWYKLKSGVGWISAQYCKKI